MASSRLLLPIPLFPISPLIFVLKVISADDMFLKLFIMRCFKIILQRYGFFGAKKNYSSSRRIIFYLKSNTMKNCCKGNTFMLLNIILYQYILIFNDIYYILSERALSDKSDRSDKSDKSEESDRSEIIIKNNKRRCGCVFSCM